MPRTSWPRAARPRHNASPMKPAAPVTTMRARPDPLTLSLRPDGASDLGANALKRRRSQRKAGSNPRGPPRSRTSAVVAIAVGDAGPRAAAEAPLLGDRGLVFLLTPSPGRPRCARGRLRGSRRDPGAHAWRR